MPLDAADQKFADDASPPSTPKSQPTSGRQTPGVSTPPGASSAGDRPKGFGRRRIWMAAAAIVVILVLAIFAFSIFSPKKTTIVTADVVTGNIEQSVLATGTLEPARLVSVGAQVSGQVKKLYVELGDVVKQGDPIADIDSTTQQNTVSNAEAGLTSQQAQRAATAASLALAEQTLARDKLLYGQGAVSQAEYQGADAQAQQLRNQLKAQDSQIKQSTLTLSTAKVNLGYTKITAPMDGTIVAVITEEGQTVNANQSAPTIVKLAQLDKMTVNAQISEADVDKVKAGQSVYFTTLGDTRTRHYAKLRAIEPAPPSIETESSSSSSSSSDAAVYYNGLFDVDNKDGSLRTGMTAQVYIIQASAKRTLLIPSSALGARSRDGTYSVKVEGDNGNIETRQVKIGIDTNVSAQVLEGLKEGEKVVVAEGGGPSAAASGSRRRGPGGLGGLGGGRRGGG